MIRPGTVLLLGAGASAPYGFPLGYELGVAIIQACAAPSDALLRNHLRHDLELLGREFERSRIDSIDAFLARRDEFSQLGKLVLAQVLLEHEARWRLHNFAPLPRAGATASGDWYRYLWNKIATEPFADLNLSGLKIVTFNYERSLEVFLLRAMQHAYHVTEQQAITKLETLEIVHVYGSFGTLQELPFGPDPLRPEPLEQAAARVLVIPEARDDHAFILRARVLLEEADHVAVLGFGFDEINLRRLNARQSLAQPRARSGGTHYRQFAASCLGLTTKAAWAIARACGHHEGNTNALPDGFIAGDCLQTLRHELVLGEWAT